jgi:hypothetical protein
MRRVRSEGGGLLETGGGEENLSRKLCYWMGSGGGPGLGRSFVNHTDLGMEATFNFRKAAA